MNTILPVTAAGAGVTGASVAAVCMSTTVLFSSAIRTSPGWDWASNCDNNSAEQPSTKMKKYTV